jgi:hypothetical protein
MRYPNGDAMPTPTQGLSDAEKRVDVPRPSEFGINIACISRTHCRHRLNSGRPPRRPPCRQLKVSDERLEIGALQFSRYPPQTTAISRSFL